MLNLASPVTTPTFNPVRPFCFASSRVASMHAIGFTPPALAMTLMPFSAISGRMRSSIARKSVA